jgi:nucleotide-binding universal stress UspA family protein
MFTRILVPTDFSEPSDAALDYGMAIAIRFGASLHLIHVVDDSLVTAMAGIEGYVPEAPSVEDMTKDAETRLASVLSTSDRSRFPTTASVVHGPPSRTIADTALDMRADLIVMGTHGRTGLTHVLLGSVAERVVRSAPCPVLTVHAKRVVIDRVFDCALASAG